MYVQHTELVSRSLIRVLREKIETIQLFPFDASGNFGGDKLTRFLDISSPNTITRSFTFGGEIPPSIMTSVKSTTILGAGEVAGSTTRHIPSCGILPTTLYSLLNRVRGRSMRWGS